MGNQNVNSSQIEGKNFGEDALLCSRSFETLYRKKENLLKK
ncbi:hypothetical protein QE450_004308 [Paenibacillus sp. SORGH_AS306]|nr:hypothetical protein [Paenibacillus sp. SORGH_AS_0306]MDR6109171.1 hypothetical protein [Paenibacillus sp. SORGH_AS_0338]